MTNDRFHSHDISQVQKEATLRALKIPTEYSNVETTISEQYMFEQLNNRQILLKILSNVRYFGTYKA